jgi:uncharacterized membrane protein
MQPMEDQAPLRPPLYFDAVLTPHRSLSPRGFLVMMGLVGIVSFISGMAFLMMGAWPVFGFFGLDAALIYFAFRLNYRAARAYETVQISEGEVRVRKVDARGNVTAWSAPPYWARVDLHEEEEAEENTRLSLISHGRAVVVGGFLAPFERKELGEAIRQGLGDARRASNPV